MMRLRLSTSSCRALSASASLRLSASAPKTASMFSRTCDFHLESTDGAMTLRDATCDSVSSPSRSSLTHLDLNSGGYALWDFPFSDMPFRLPFTPSPEMVGFFLRRALSCPEIASHITSPV